MPFKIFPDHLISPETVAPGVQSAPYSFDADALAQIGSHPNPIFAPEKAVVIRVNMLGPAPATPDLRPTVWIAAKTPTGTFGSGLEMMHGANTGIRDENDLTVGFGSGSGPLVAGPYQFAVVISQPGREWQISVKNNDTVPRRFTWVVGGDDNQSTQPWIDVLMPGEAGFLCAPDPLNPSASVRSPVNLNFNTLVNGILELDLEVWNYGTGQLTLDDAFGGFIGASRFKLSFPSASPISPGGSAVLRVSWEPDAPGPQNLIHPVISSDPTEDGPQVAVMNNPCHNRLINLVGTASRLELGLALDASGSMEAEPDGTLPAVNPDRWTRLVQAVSEFFDFLAAHANESGRFGVALFPNTNAGATGVDAFAEQLVSPPANQADNNITVGIVGVSPDELDLAKTALAAKAPRWAGTPMGAGMQYALEGNPAGGAGFFMGVPNNPPPDHSRWLVLMSDGAHNTPDPNASPPDPPQPTSYNNAFFVTNNSINAITIGYGNPGTWEVEHGTLTQVAVEAGANVADPTIVASEQSVFRSADASSYDIAGLRNVFQKVALHMLGLTPVSDPSGVLTHANPSFCVQILLVPADVKATFTVNWGTVNPNAVRIDIVTPCGQRVTGADAGNVAGFTFHGGNSYQMLTFDRGYQNGPDREELGGTWSLLITALNLHAGQEENFEYSVVTRSGLNLDVLSNETSRFAGDPIEVRARLVHRGVPVDDAHVKLRVAAPESSADNWLASKFVSPAVMAQTRTRLENAGHEELNALHVKAEAVGVAYPGATNEIELEMEPAGQPGIYRAAIENTSIPGTYDLTIAASGHVDGYPFEREQGTQANVTVKPEEESSWIDQRYRRDRASNGLIADLRVWPRDRFGNVVLSAELFGPAVSVTTPGRGQTTVLESQLDGSYTGQLSINTNGANTFLLKVGQLDVGSRSVPRIAEMQFPGEAKVRFGGEAVPGLNRHKDKSVITRDPLDLQPDEFVALGAGGELVITWSGNLAVGSHAEDLTVFVHVEDRPRSFRVEVRKVGWRRRWVDLGTAMVTTSYSLRMAGIRYADEIRITDLSHATQDENGNPLDAPGANIIGIGTREARPSGSTTPCRVWYYVIRDWFAGLIH